MDMELEFLWKTGGSGNGGCPALYRVEGDTPGYVVQGVKLNASTRSRLRDLAAEEDAVWVPADVLDKLRSQ